jgi:hypothetical protein
MFDDKYFKRYGHDLSARLFSISDSGSDSGSDSKEHVRSVRRYIANDPVLRARRDESLAVDRFRGVLVAVNDHPDTVLSDILSCLGAINSEAIDT